MDFVRVILLKMKAKWLACEIFWSFPYSRENDKNANMHWLFNDRSSMHWKLKELCCLQPFKPKGCKHAMITYPWPNLNAARCTQFPLVKGKGDSWRHWLREISSKLHWHCKQLPAFHWSHGTNSFLNTFSLIPTHHVSVFCLVPVKDKTRWSEIGFHDPLGWKDLGFFFLETTMTSQSILYECVLYEYHKYSS